MADQQIQAAADWLAQSAKQHRQRGDAAHAAMCDLHASRLRSLAEDCPGCPRCGGDPCAICESPDLCKEHGCGDLEFKRQRRSAGAERFPLPPAKVQAYADTNGIPPAAGVKEDGRG